MSIYGRYTEFLEMARTELLRNIGFPPQELQDEYGLICPVLELNIKYKKSARYDDVIKIKTEVKEANATKILIEYEISNQMGELLCTAMTINCGVDDRNFKLSKLPPELIEKLNE